VARFFSEQPPCLVGIKACGSAHYWARMLNGLEHTVRLMAPQFVNSGRLRRKNTGEMIKLADALRLKYRKRSKFPT
jgi:transposase